MLRLRWSLGKLALWVVAAVLLASSLSPTRADPPPPSGDLEGSGDVLSQMVPGGSRSVAQAGYTTWRTDVGAACRYIDHNFTIDVNAKPSDMTDPSLTLRVWDVDYQTTGCPGGPEVDKVYINNNFLGILKGANNSWSTAIFPLNTAWIRGATDTLPWGGNAIKIDTDSTGTGCWCVGVSWGEIKAKVGFRVVSVTPSDGTRNVDWENPNITATFSREYDPATLTTDTFAVEYRDPGGSWLKANGAIVAASARTATFRPTGVLIDGIRYRASIVAGAAGVKDKDGNELEEGREWYFWTMVDLDGQTAALYPPSTSRDQIEIAPIQVARDAKLVPGKPGVVRVYARWDEKASVHADDQVTEMTADVRRQTITQFAVTIKRPDKYTAVEKKAAQNSVNFFDFPLWGDGYINLDATITPQPQPQAQLKSFQKTMRATYHDRSPRITFRYRFLRVGTWSGGVPAASRRAGYTLMKEGADFTTDNFPAISTAVSGHSDFTPAVAPGAPPTWDEVERVAQNLWDTLREEGEPPTERLIAAVVPQDFRPTGETYTGVAITWGWFWKGRVIMLVDGLANAGTVAHEMGHAYMLGSDLDHENSAAGIEGFRVSQRQNKSFEEGNGEAADIRSLMHRNIQPVGTQWIDNTQYNSLFNTVTATALRTLASPADYLLISGRIKDNATVEFSPLRIRSLTDPPVPTPGSYSVVLQDATDKTLSTTSFQPEASPIITHGGGITPTLPYQPFSLAVPLASGTSRVAVKYGTTILGQVTRSANSPVITITAPISGTTWGGTQTATWAGSDADGDTLYYYLSYSPDGGATWTALTGEGTGASYTFDTTKVAPGTAARVRLVATDGFNTAEKTVFLTVSNNVVVIAVSPASGVTNTVTTSPLRAFFLNNLVASQVNTTTFTLKDASNRAVSGQVSYDQTTRVATFLPTAPLEYVTQYTAALGASLADTEGNTLGSTYSWSFTTQGDGVPPRVAETSPRSWELRVPINAIVSATFDEALTASTVTTSTFSLASAGGSVTGTVGYAAPSRTASFLPGANLAPNSPYTATLATGIKDAAGNALERAYAWSFVTSAITSTGVRLTGVYSDTINDTNGDGLYDNLTIGARVEVVTAGTYNLNGRLMDARGEEIEWATTGDRTLAQGLHTLGLVFTSDAIRSHGLNGPFTLSALHIYNTTDAAISDRASEAYATAAYTAASFHAILTITGLPDQTLLLNTSKQDAFNLNDYAAHATLPKDQLTYVIDIITDSNCGVSIDASDNVDINPTAGWTGYCDATMKVTGGGKTARDTFRVTVTPFQTYLPFAVKKYSTGW